jgi:hypothetical protein
MYKSRQMKYFRKLRDSVHGLSLRRIETLLVLENQRHGKTRVTPRTKMLTIGFLPQRI